MSEPRNYFDDLQTFKDVGVATVLLYSGYDLVSIQGTGKSISFQFVIPKEELSAILKDYAAGLCGITDAKSYNAAGVTLFARMKVARVFGKYVDTELVKLAKAQGVTIT